MKVYRQRCPNKEVSNLRMLRSRGEIQALMTADIILKAIPDTAYRVKGHSAKIKRMQGFRSLR